MKTDIFKKIIKEAVREAIQEELKDILLEAVRSPKTSIVTENIQPSVSSSPKIDKRAMMQAIMGDFSPGQDTLSFNSTNINNTFQARPGMDTISEGSALPSGNVGLDQIMSLMKGGK